MVAWGYIFVTAVIAWRIRALAAFVALPALIGTMALFLADVDNAAAYSSALWCVAGVTLLINSEYVAGVLYGISGLIYVPLYLGASNATLAIIPILSDIAFGLGLIAGTWPNALAWLSRVDRCAVRRTAVQIAREDLARSALRSGAER